MQSFCVNTKELKGSCNLGMSVLPFDIVYSSPKVLSFIGLKSRTHGVDRKGVCSILLWIYSSVMFCILESHGQVVKSGK